MGCDTMPTKSSSESYGMQEREALQLVLENLSMIGLNSNFFEKENGLQNGEVINENLSSAEPKRVSANITENIPVPSSEHVAEIVGKQGCKIKALRNKTNTYIKTPGRGDEPVFIITGRREDVDVAKAEILQASEHFSNIRAQRKGIAPPPIQPGQITKTIRVPYRVVGLVVGPKGQTIKQIQQKTQTYIVTPSRERDPVFEITGQPDSVEQARLEISNYIAARTGTFIDSEKKAIAPAVATWNADARKSSENLEAGVPEEISEFLEDLFSGSNATISPPRSKRSSMEHVFAQEDANPGAINGSSTLPEPYMLWKPAFINNSAEGNSKGKATPTSSPPNELISSNSDPPSSSGSSSSYSSFNFEISPLVRSSSFPVSGTNESTTIAASTSRSSQLAPISGTVRKASLLLPLPCSQVNQSASDPWNIASLQSDLPASGLDESKGPGPLLESASLSTSVFGCEKASNGVANSTSSLPGMTDATAAAIANVKNCIICEKNGISAALVPCGHNLFCYDCVSLLVQSTNAFCPVCHQPADHALRILQ